MTKFSIAEHAHRLEISISRWSKKKKKINTQQKNQMWIHCRPFQLKGDKELWLKYKTTYTSTNLFTLIISHKLHAGSYSFTLISYWIFHKFFLVSSGRFLHFCRLWIEFVIWMPFSHWFTLNSQEILNYSEFSSKKHIESTHFDLCPALFLQSSGIWYTHIRNLRNFKQIVASEKANGRARETQMKECVTLCGWPSATANVLQAFDVIEVQRLTDFVASMPNNTILI